MVCELIKPFRIYNKDRIKNTSCIHMIYISAKSDTIILTNTDGIKTIHKARYNFTLFWWCKIYSMAKGSSVSYLFFIFISKIKIKCFTKSLTYTIIPYLIGAYHKSITKII